MEQTIGAVLGKTDTVCDEDGKANLFAEVEVVTKNEANIEIYSKEC